ncbi:HipA family kinase [Jiangella anatolica]|uniref:HipA family kinase n=1 Tax=Jiangella anatolica TaxID=2670374 RepID=UPI0011B763F5|nr:HipA family kinase [Jiangella anatolica]
MTDDAGGIGVAPRVGMSVSEVGPLVGSGQTGASWGTASVLVKRNSAEHPNVVANEFIANRLAMLMAVPVPAGDVWTGPDGEDLWICGVIRRGNYYLPPPTPAQLHLIPGIMRARMIVFDTWILNSDRHDENVMCDSSGDAWLIDHDQALFARATEDRSGKLYAARRQKVHGSVIEREAMPSSEHLKQAIAGLQAVPRAAVVGQLEEARRRNLVTGLERDRLRRTLSYRADNIRSLVQVPKDDPREEAGRAPQDPAEEGRLT